MALNLGDINFGMEVDTRGLQTAVSQMKRFGRQVDSVANAQSSAARSTVRALGRQERAMKSAIQQALNLRRQLKRTEGATPEMFANTSNSLRQFTKVMSSGELTTLEFNRAQDKFRAQLGKTRRQLGDLKAKSAAKDINRFQYAMRELSSASALALGPLSGAAARIQAISAISSRSTLAITGLIAAITAGSVALYGLVRIATRSAMAMERIQARMVAATGSTSGAAEAFDEAADITRRFGLDLRAVADEYAQMRAAARSTGMQVDDTRDIFEGFSAAAAALRLNVQATEGVFRAVTQIMSKGTVQAEELRGQLGERLPGAFGLAAQAMGVTTAQLNRMLERGDVLASDLLPKLAELLQETFGKNAADNANTLQGSINKVNNQILLLGDRLDRALGISRSFIAILQGTSRALKTISDNLPEIIGGFGALVGAMAGLFAPQLIRGALSLVKIMWNLSRALFAVVVGSAALKGKSLAQVLTRVASTVAAAAAGYSLLSSIAEEGLEKAKDLGLEIDDLGDGVAAEGLSTALQKVVDSITEMKTEYEQLRKQIANPLRISEFEMFHQAATETQKLLADLSQKDLKRLATELNNLGVSQTVLGGMAKNAEDARDAISSLFLRISAMDEIKNVISSTNTELEEVRSTLVKLDTLEALAKQTLQGEELLTVLERIKRAQREAVDEYTGVTQGIKQINESMSSAFTEAIIETQRLDDALDQILKTILKVILQMTIMKNLQTATEPLWKSFLRNVAEGAGTSAAAGNTEGGTGASGERLGSAWSAGIRKMRTGGILDRKTYFNTSEGRAMAGEAGPEGVLPLARTRSGELGVKSSGSGGGGQTVIIQDQRGAGAPAIQQSRSRDRDGKEVLRLMIRSEVHAMGADGGLDGVMAQYGQRRRPR